MISIWAIFCGCFLVIINKFLRYFKLLLLLLEPLFQHALKHCLVRAFNFLDALFDKNYSLKWDLLKSPRFFLGKIPEFILEIDQSLQSVCDLLGYNFSGCFSEYSSLIHHLKFASLQEICHLVNDNLPLTLLVVNWFKVTLLDVALLRRHTVWDQSFYFTLLFVLVIGCSVVEVETALWEQNVDFSFYFFYF